MAAPITTIDMYILLREKIGDQQAKTHTDYVTQQVENTFEKHKVVLATKDDIADLKIRIPEAKPDTIKWVFTFSATIALMIVGLYLKK